MQPTLLRLAYLGATNALAMVRLLPTGDRDKDIETLTLRHQISVLQRQLHGDTPEVTPADRTLLAVLLHQLPRDVLGRIPHLQRRGRLDHSDRPTVLVIRPS